MIGIILAGGTANRMGGGDKGLRLVGGVPILTRIIATLHPQCETLVLNVNGEAERFAGFGLPIVSDGTSDQRGPLAGILAGLDWCALHHPASTTALIAPTDTPFLPDDLVAGLARSDADIVCARSDGRVHPTASRWSVALRHDLRTALDDEGIRKVGRFLERHVVSVVDWPAMPVDPFFNANTPADLERANAIAACGQPTASL